ncbi:hypothetical protein OSTOST_07141 [Ostertagia ostertagi]
MCSIALRVTAFTMLLYLSQVTPGLPCTFTHLNTTRLANVKRAFYALEGAGAGLGICFSYCYTTPGCIFVSFAQKIQFCEVFVPGEQDETIPESYRPEIYKFDRNVTITSCPTVKQWMAQKTTVAA